VAVKNGLSNELKMSQIGTLLMEFDTSVSKSGCGSGWVAVVFFLSIFTHFLNKKNIIFLVKISHFPMKNTHFLIKKHLKTPIFLCKNPSKTPFSHQKHPFSYEKHPFS
jgi:hypothetical protein